MRSYITSNSFSYFNRGIRLKILPFRNCSIGAGSVQVSHSDSVMAAALGVRLERQAPAVKQDVVHSLTRWSQRVPSTPAESAHKCPRTRHFTLMKARVSSADC